MRVAIVKTGFANLSSVSAWLARAGVEGFVTEDAELVRREAFVILPGVGSFGPAAEALRRRGLDRALSSRLEAGAPTAGFCLGMQLFFEASEEDPGVPGLGLLPGRFKAQPAGTRSPRLGWGAVEPEGVGGLVWPGWAAFANSYRLETPPPGMLWARADYGGPFVASCERPGLLLCQFHPELSGEWGASLLRRWLEGSASGAGPGASETGPGVSEAGSAAGGARPSSAGSLPGERAVRVIPCLDVDGGRVVKGRQFKDLRDAGDPAELAARYEGEGADEIVILDITAGIEGRATRLDTLRRVRERVGIPIAVGGGLGSIEDAARLFDAGADRVSVNTRAVRDPAIVETIASRYGRQAVVVAIDVTRRGENWEVLVDAGRTATGLDALEWSRRAAELGAGEILLTSRDRDGTGLGYDLDLLRAVSSAVPISVIASGGAATPAQMVDGALSGAGAVLAAGAFHFGSYSIREVKSELLSRGLEARP
ncbi:MAG TPA: imidazole glycerol phosphate synthase subunit HisH [Rectinemataceae bacterium]|nr:imidazole glycerol phosphate synthase subunit HisH [Rectinemataceae bacterium]